MLHEDGDTGGFDTENQVDLATFIQFTCQSPHLMFVPLRKHLFFSK